MEIKKVEGIVISDTNYLEASKILNIFTKEYGIISVISKGSRNIKSKLRGISSKFIYANFNIAYKEKGMHTLIDGDQINSLRNTLRDLDSIYYLNSVIDLCKDVYKESKDNNIYNLLIDTVLKIEERIDPLLLYDILALKLLNYLGIKPNIDNCSICGNSNNILTLSIPDGGFICKNCYKGGKIYNEKVIKLLRMFYYVDIKSISKLSVNEINKKEIELFVKEYYESYSGIYLKYNKGIIK